MLGHSLSVVLNKRGRITGKTANLNNVSQKKGRAIEVKTCMCSVCRWDTWALQVGAMFQISWWTDCVLRGAMQCKRHREDQHGKWVTAQKSGNSNLGPQRPPFSVQPSDYPSHLPSR